LASRQSFGALKTEQLGGHSQEQQRHRQAPIDDDDDNFLRGGASNFTKDTVGCPIETSLSSKLLSFFEKKMPLLYTFGDRQTDEQMH